MAILVKTGDTAPSVKVTLLDASSQAVDLAGATVKFIMSATPTSTPVVDAAAVLEQVGDGSDGSKGKVRYDWLVTDTATAGSYVAEFEVVYASGKRQTFPTTGYVDVTINGDLGGTA